MRDFINPIVECVMVSAIAGCIGHAILKNYKIIIVDNIIGNAQNIKNSLKNKILSKCRQYVSCKKIIINFKL